MIFASDLDPSNFDMDPDPPFRNSGSGSETLIFAVHMFCEININHAKLYGFVQYCYTKYVNNSPLGCQLVLDLLQGQISIS